MSAMVISWGGSVLGVRAGFKGAQGARALGLTPAKSGRAGGGGKCPTFRETAAPGARNEDRSVTETDGRCRATAAQISPRPGVHQPSSMILSPPRIAPRPLVRRLPLSVSSTLYFSCNYFNDYFSLLLEYCCGVGSNS